MRQVVSRVLHDLVFTVERHLLLLNGRSSPRMAGSGSITAAHSGHNDVTQHISNVTRKGTSPSSSDNDRSVGLDNLMPNSAPSLLTENGQDALLQGAVIVTEKHLFWITR